MKTKGDEKNDIHAMWLEWGFSLHCETTKSTLAVKSSGPPLKAGKKKIKKNGGLLL